MSAGFRLYLAARTVSIAGSQLALVALTVLVVQLGGGAAGVSVLLLAFTVPRLLGPLAGAIADRTDNKRLMIGCDTAQAVLYTGLAWVRWWPAVVAVVVIATGFSTLYQPAGRSSIPALAGRENLARANARLAIGQNAALAAGPAIAGVVLTLTGPAPALILNAASFAISAALTSRVAGLRKPSASAHQSTGPVTIFGAARAGLAGVFGNQVARTLAITLLPSVGFASLDNAALVFLVRQGYHVGPSGYAWVVTAFSAGMVGVPITLSALRSTPSARLLFFAGQGVYGAATIVTGLVRQIAVAGGAQFVAGGANGMENVGMDTLLAQSAPDSELGTVFGVVYTAPYAGQILAYLLATPLLVAFGPRLVFVISGAGVLTVLAVTMVLLAPAGKRSVSTAR
jgi:MFS family permease